MTIFGRLIVRAARTRQSVPVIPQTLNPPPSACSRDLPNPRLLCHRKFMSFLPCTPYFHSILEFCFDLNYILIPVLLCNVVAVCACGHVYDQFCECFEASG